MSQCPGSTGKNVPTCSSNDQRSRVRRLERLAAADLSPKDLSLGRVRGDSLLVGVPKAVEGRLVERTTDELHADRQPRGGKAAGDGETREAVEVRRAREAGHRRADGLLVASDVDLPLVYERRGDRQRRGQEDVRLTERPAELVLRQEFPLLGVRVAIGFRAFAVQEALADLLSELLGLGLQALLMDGVGVGGQGEPLRLERLPEVRDPDLPYLCAE